MHFSCLYLCYTMRQRDIMKVNVQYSTHVILLSCIIQEDYSNIFNGLTTINVNMLTFHLCWSHL